MSCAETLNTQASIDGEVIGAEAAAAERHIETCAECQTFCADAAALSDDIRKVAGRYRAPTDLKARVERMLYKEVARQTDIRTGPKRAARRSFWFGALGGAGVTGFVTVMAIITILPPSVESLVDSVTDAHTQALLTGRTIAVVSTDHHTVKPWFAGRVALSPPVTDFAAQGFKLVGGRLDRVADQPAAVVAYQHGLHEVDLFVWADRGSALNALNYRRGRRIGRATGSSGAAAGSAAPAGWPFPGTAPACGAFDATGLGGVAHSVSQTSNTGCSTAFRPGFSANIQPLKIRCSLPSRRISCTSTNDVVLGGSVGGRE